ncbi:hypothetical protein FOCC_FOCC002240 [Frankliniella occidentalis]|nr:hypothetical protein FOCC_FOCC002240 [Frankliniella occidentalis]
MVLSRLVWCRWPPRCPGRWPLDDEYRGQGVPLSGDALVGVPPLYSPCMFRALPLPCKMAPQLQREFEALCALSAQYAAGASSRAGHLPQNACKNRYCNIIPFDRTRGYSGSTEYIASQGPKEGTTKDFWFMVYEQNVRLIIMLTKLVEDGKGSEQRLVHHLHFLDWPDFGCPASSVHVLQFCRTVRRHALLFPGLMEKSSTVNTFAFASAGVGRTGTLIAVDILLQRLKAKKKIDIFGVVMKLREQRPFMVQCQQQYIFIYKCLKAAFDDPNVTTYKASCTFPVNANMHLQNGLQMVKKSILSSWKK